MKQYVIDTSIIVKWLSDDHEENIELANKLLEATLDGEIELLVPELAKYEVGNVLLFSKKLSAQQGITVLSHFYSLPISFITESEDLAEETFSQAYLYGVTYYDAAFLALAKKYDATLITENTKHQGKYTDVRVTSLLNFNK